MKNVMIWGRFRVRHEADKNSMNLCQIIPTHFGKHNIITSWTDERVEDEEYEMSYEWQTGQIKVPRDS